MAEIISGNVLNELVKQIPEIKNLLLEELNWWRGEEPGLHNIFGNVLNPFLVELLAKEGEEELKVRIFGFLEQMAISPDEYVENILAVTVLERLGDDKSILEEAYKYMGAQTRITSDQIEIGWGRL